MSNTTGQVTQKKGLGRGLGSLLGGGSSTSTENKPENGTKTPGFLTEKTLKAASPTHELNEMTLAKPDLPKETGRSEVRMNAPSETVLGVISKSDSVLSQENLEAKVWSIPIEKIVANPNQPRKTFEPQKLNELVASIRSKGVLQPITVRRVGLVFEIIAGERRWRASQLAGLHEVPAIVRSATDQDALELALIENIQRHELNPIEEARAFQELQQKFKLTHDQISEKVGKERVTITNSLRLLGLPNEVQSMVADGRLSAGHAKVLLGVSSPADVERLANEILKKKLSVRKLELEVKRLVGRAENQKSDIDVGSEAKIMLQLVRDLEEDLQKRIGTKVKVNYQNHQGSIEISFYSDDQLTELAERIKDSWKTTKGQPI